MLGVHKRVLRAVLTGLIPIAMLGLASSSASASGATPTLAEFKACVQKVQGSLSPHSLTLAEAQRCGSGLPQIQRRDIDSIGAAKALPALFLVVFGDRAAIEWTGQSTPALAAAGASPQSCSNAWTYPDPGFWDLTDWGNLSMAGYGNHCNYANIPSNPTFGYGCVPGCGVSQSVGHADSVWDQRNYGINSALGWGNVSLLAITKSEHF